MTLARAREVYDQHIRDLSVTERLRLLALLASDLSAQAESIPEQPPRDIMALYGLGKDRGVGMDAQEYVQRLREGRSIRADED